MSGECIPSPPSKAAPLAVAAANVAMSPSQGTGAVDPTSAPSAAASSSPSAAASSAPSAAGLLVRLLVCFRVRLRGRQPTGAAV